MGLLVDGAWKEDVPRREDGHFVRAATAYQSYITPDGSPGATGKGGFAAEAGRYHLYVSLACPWASRTLILRKLKKLEDVISVSVTKTHLGKAGWEFGTEPGATPDSVNGKSTLADIYLLADPHYSGRVSVPVLWDKKQRTIVNNESAENHSHAQFRLRDVYQRSYRLLSRPVARGDRPHQRDRLCERQQRRLPPCFATTQAAYEEAARALFATLDDLEVRLSRQRYLVGRQITEADWRLFTTLVRFDAIYYSHFKCNVRHRLSNLWNYLRDLYQVPGVADTVNLDHIKRHYYGSHRSINPTGIAPIGPLIDFTMPHDRSRFG
jgi:glutathionyl-hydroquinone reductase